MVSGDQSASGVVSFQYDSRVYEGFSPEHFELIDKKEEALDNKKSVSFLFKKDESLHVRLLFTHYPSHGASEWTVWFENPSDNDSGLIENVKTKLNIPGANARLSGIYGDHTNWYRPYSIDLGAMPASFESNSGRATHVNFPYFNLECSDGGAMLAIGWAGTWKADFVFDGCSTEFSASSVNGLKTILKSGEKIRTALFVYAPYAVRNENYAVNYWRSFFIECNLPKYDNKNTPLAPFSTCCLASDTGIPNSDGSISERHFTWKRSLEKMFEEDAKVDFRWFDAGWYIAPDLTSPETDWWGSVGTWTLDKNKWPGDSFLESTEFARRNGMKTLMWFEPERVTDPENLAKNFGYNVKWAIRREGVNAISNNIGDDECYRWTVDRIIDTLRENKVEMYREDNNSDPAGLWKYLDEIEGGNRQGITECKFIDAHYRMWDEIIQATLSYGGCGFVDSCASGGGRNDLESLRRGVPLLRSDFDRTTTSIRLSMSSSFNKWIPFCGANTKEKKGQVDPVGLSDKYIWRASYLPVLNVDSQFVQDPDQDFGVLRFGLKEWKKVNRYLLKDFYVHTPWHTEEENTGFTAYSYYDSEKREGVLLAFRQERCMESEIKISLPYVKEDETISITDEDTGKCIRLSGREIRKNRLALSFDHPRCARLLWVKAE